MAQIPQESDHKGSERAESKTERTEKKAENKERAESSEGMEDHSKKVAVETKEKRVTRKSGVTGKFAEKGKPGLASADSLLPLEEPNRHKGREKADRPAHAEEGYLKGQPANWGKLGSSRSDVVIGEKNNPFASVCLKTLDAVPSAQQERGWVRNVPKLADGSVAARLYLRIESQKR